MNDVENFRTDLAIFEANSTDALLYSREDFWKMHVEYFTECWNASEKARWHLVIIAGSLDRSYGKSAVKTFHHDLAEAGTIIDIFYIYDFLLMYEKLVKTNLTQVKYLSFTAHKQIARMSENQDQVELFIETAVKNPDWSVLDLQDHIRSVQSRMLTDGNGTEKKGLSYHGKLNGKSLDFYHEAEKVFETENPRQIFEKSLETLFGSNESGNQVKVVRFEIPAENYQKFISCVENIEDEYTTLEAYLLNKIYEKGR
jgi:hypothetical protein